VAGGRRDSGGGDWLGRKKGGKKLSGGPAQGPETPLPTGIVLGVFRAGRDGKRPFFFFIFFFFFFFLWGGARSSGGQGVQGLRVDLIFRD